MLSGISVAVAVGRVLELFFWIPAFAGMTGYGECRGAKPLCRGLGCPQNLLIVPQDWGIKGVERCS